MVAKVLHFNSLRDTKHTKPQTGLVGIVVSHENFAEFDMAVFSCEVQGGFTVAGILYRPKEQFPPSS